MPDSMPEASPTLMLMPGQGFDHTVGLQVRRVQCRACAIRNGDTSLLEETMPLFRHNFKALTMTTRSSTCKSRLHMPASCSMALIISMLPLLLFLL